MSERSRKLVLLGRELSSKENGEVDECLPSCSNFAKSASLVGREDQDGIQNGHTTVSDDFEDFEDSSDEFIPDSDEFNSSDDSEMLSSLIVKNKTNEVNLHVTAEDTSTRVDENIPHIDPAANIGRKSRGRRKVEEGQESRKRKRRPQNWNKNVRKQLKTEGKRYNTSSGKEVSAKQLKSCCKCRRRCYEKFSSQERRLIFDHFYALSSQAQNQFIANHVQEKTKKVERLRQNNKESRRKFSRCYFLIKNTDDSVEVCQTMFVNTLDLTIKKIRVIVEKKRQSGSGICLDDERGRHKNHPKISEEARQVIKTHINMFPTYQSHYSRSHTKKLYLSPDLSISQMYRLYIEYCAERNLEPKSLSAYRQTFVEDFNLSFHKPSNDTCGTCDKHNTLIKSCTESEKESILNQQEQHLNAASMAYNEKKRDRTKCLSNQNMIVASFDLQKCLPTPFLRCGFSFYKRKLWTYNLTIFESSSKGNSALCFVWNETIARRGGQEIASCLLAYLRQIPANINEIIFYSDCCPGQNRNIYLSILFLLVTEEFREKGRTVTITHKFLIPGHTHMEADTIHAAIEKTKKVTTANVDIPRDWANLIRMVPRNPPIIVHEMEQRQFFNFKLLMGNHYQHRKKNTECEPIVWKDIRIMQYRHDAPGIVFYKTSFVEETQFKQLDLSKNTRRKSKPILRPISVKPLGIPANKLQHLHDLLPYVDKGSRPYYAQFLSSLTSSASARDSLDAEPDEDVDDSGESMPND